MFCPNISDTKWITDCPLFLTWLILLPNKTLGCGWTCPDLIYYCQHMVTMTQFLNTFTNHVHNFFQPYCLVPLGILGNFLLFLTLLSPILSGTTFTFLRLVSGAQLCQGILLAVQQIIQGQKSFLTSAKLGLAAAQIELLAMAVKMTICMLSVFLTLDRALAVSTPCKYYASLNKRKFVLGSLIASIFVSCIYIERAVEFGTGLNMTKMYFIKIVIFAIISIKGLILITLIFLSMIIVYNVKKRDRKIVDMLSAEALAKEHHDSAYLCRFQMVDTLVMVIDLSMTLFFDIIVSFCGQVLNVIMPTLLDDCTFRYTTYVLDLVFVCDFAGEATKLILSLAHGELFIVYLIFFKKFRLAFFNVFRRFFSKFKKRRGSLDEANGHLHSPTMKIFLVAPHHDDGDENTKF